MQSLVIDPRARQLVLATFAMAMAAVLGILALGQTVPAHAINPPGTVGVVCGHTCPSGTDDYSRAEGSADTVNVANFTGTGAPSDFTASINWGDGSPIGGGTISSPSAGNFVVAGTHPYADEASAGAPYVIVVTITGVNSANDNGNGAQATITEGDALTSTNTPASVSATENTQFSGTVATFTDSFSNPGSDFTADIAWGDGNTDTGLPVTGGSGSPLVVAGSHTYADEISSGTITVTVHDNAPGTGVWTATPSVTAAEADTLSGTGTAVAATENSSFTGQVASFTNTGYSSNVPADFSATINWGDGLTNDPGAVTGGGGSPLLVSGTHTYADECSCSVTATLTDNTPGSAQATSTTSTATVGEGDTAVAITGTSPINVNENVAIPATHVLGTFTTNYTGNIAGDFTVTVDWGDGSTSTGTLTGGAGTFTIKGGHTYGDECTCTVTVTVADNSPGGTATVSASNFANIADTDQITPSGSVITPTEGTSFSGTVGSFSTANTNNLASDFTASIDWGDTLTSAGTITGASGSFTVSGTHTYAEEGPHAVKITVTDDPLLPFPTGSNPVANPGFETGGLTGWTSSSTTANAVVAVNTTSHSGTWSARLGNPANDTTNGTNSLWQDIAIPPGVSALSTWIQPHCTDTVTFDQQRILLQTTGGGALATVMADACSDYGAAGDWRHITFDTSAYAGTTVRLLFQVHDDGQSDPTWMFVDDTRIQASPVISSTANVADAALVGSGGFLVTAVENTPVNNITLATFTDTDPGGLQGDAVHETSGDYTANITWGDSTPDSAGTITGPDTNGVYTVTAATHTFPEEGGPGLTIVITDNVQQATVLANADVTDAALTNHNTTLSSTEGVPFTHSVGTFTDADNVNDRGINPPGDYTADINWGDGTAHSVGTVTGSAGSFDVAGTHTYAEQGPWTITTVVTDIGHATTTITSTTTTADNTLTNTPGTAIGATEGTQLSAVSLGGFHDNDPGEGPGELPSDYSVSIDWGDS
ncbi:MAG TPA: hypothetical protein VG245_03950, partial [Candidatus Dormibacteraeota bacterium]|nr:hypothetical protein [Candidatus Dormibacteraeota bacterium]